MGKKDAALMEATLFGPALSGTGELPAGGIEHVCRHGFEKTGGVVLFGMGRGQSASDAAIFQGQSHRLMNGTVGRKSAGGGEGVVSR